MKAPDSSTLRKAASSSGISGAYCALTSTSGTLGMAVKSRGPYAPNDQVSGEQDDDPDDREVHVAEVAVRVRVARPQRPADPREAEAEHRAAHRGEGDEEPERHLEDPGRDGDEGAHERRGE